MPDSAPIASAELFSNEQGEIFADAGLPHYTRRLTDKILAAFNHAYALGHVDIARSLWECLAAAESLTAGNAHRRPNQALDLAADWVAFVDARERYREAAVPSAAAPGAPAAPATAAPALDAADAYGEMVAAYKTWRQQKSR
jgi:hypothetical protein